jgi:hypothetical protein
MTDPTTRRKPGRRPLPPDARMVLHAVRLRPETLAAIERTAQNRGVTPTDIIRTALSAWLETQAEAG